MGAFSETWGKGGQRWHRSSQTQQAFSGTSWAAPVPSPPHPTFTCSSDPAHNVGGVSLTLQLGKLRFLEGFTACRSQRLSLKSPA